MTSKIDQKSYLQKYLSGSSSDKKKKKKKVQKGKGFKIIDDDLDLTKLRALDGDELDVFDQGEDGPQIAGIIDERPEEVKKLEQFKTSSKWRVVNQDDGFNSKLQIEEIKKDIKEAQKENELVFGKMYSDSEDEKQNDSDLSPPRIKPNNKTNGKETKNKKHNSDSDFSPPRRGRDSPPRKGNKNNDSDISPPRKRNKNDDSDISPPRKRNKNDDSDISPPRKRNGNDDSDISPPRKHIEHKPARSRKQSRWGDADPIVPERRAKSPSPKRSKHRGSSHKQRRSKSPESDLSPPRKSRKEDSRRNRSRDRDIPQNRRKSPEQSSSKHKDRNVSSEKSYQRGPDNRQRRNSNDSDLSPPRKHKRKSVSPPRRPKNHKGNSSKRTRDSSSDLSPPRKEKNRHERNYARSDNSPPPSNKKMEKTLDGKLAGLQDARQLREENEAFRRREEDVYNKMTDEVSGRNAKAVSRKASKRETSEERQKQKEKAERQKELDEKYKKWSKGLKQIEAQEARMQDFMHEASKPLARHKDDRDLENSLKDVLRDGDPMLQYIMEKKREKGELGPAKPIYKGQFPPNRFNIRPGYRWDGVDRSNGYEKKFFDQRSKRKAQEEEAYKWSTEDL